MTTKTTGKFNKGKNNGTAVCDECGTRRQKANGQDLGGGSFICDPCFDKAGDQNAVSDGHMTCDQFQAQYGEHSEYCPGHAAKGRHVLTAEERRKGGLKAAALKAA